MSVLSIPVTKAKGFFVEIDTDIIPQEVYLACLKEGLKHFINRMSKVVASNFSTQSELEAAAKAKAEENKADILSGKIRIIGLTRAKQAGDGIVMTEALRLAKINLKSMMKASGIKVSHVSAADITKAARALVQENDTEYRRLAEASLASASGIKSTLDVTSVIAVDPGKVKKAEAKKAEAKSPKQASKVIPSKKGKPVSVHA